MQQLPSFPPVTSAIPNLPHAGFLRRALSNTVDSPLLFASILAYCFSTRLISMWIALSILKAVYFAVFKVNPGRMLTKTRVYSLTTGEALGVGALSLRSFAHVADFATFVGWFRPIWNKQNQTFADTIMGTVVIRVDKLAEQSGTVIEANFGSNPDPDGSPKADFRQAS